MKKLILLLVLLASPIFASDEINITATIKDHSTNTRNSTIISGFHSFNIKNTTGIRKTYKCSWCSGLTNDIDCSSKTVVLNPGASYNDHWNSGAFVAIDKKGTYPIVAETKVNDVVVQSHATLTVT